jgi:Skp family chaperone for outer membrane proteins
MKDYQKWQYFAELMNKERTEKGANLAKIRNAVMDVQNKLQTEGLESKKKELEQQMVALQRQFEDEERKVRKEIDEKSAMHLRTLFAEIRTVVDAVARTNGFELVLAYPDALTDEDRNNPVYFDLKLRPQAAMPFYVSPNIDITTVVVQTLNKNFPPPGPVTPAAATAPPAAPAGGQK